MMPLVHVCPKTLWGKGESTINMMGMLIKKILIRSLKDAETYSTGVEKKSFALFFKQMLPAS